MEVFLTFSILLYLYLESHLLVNVCYIFFHKDYNKLVDCFQVISIILSCMLHIAAWVRFICNSYVEILSLIPVIYLSEPFNIFLT